MKRLALLLGSLLVVTAAASAKEVVPAPVVVEEAPVQIVEKEVNGKKMFAVIIGNYATKESLEKNRSIVEKICNCETIIYEKK